jgi:hypothetical protein
MTTQKWHTTHIMSSVEKPTDSHQHHKQVLKEIFSENTNQEGLRMGEIMQKYKKELENPKSRRTVQRYIRELVQQNFLKWKGSTTTRRYKKAF